MIHWWWDTPAWQRFLVVGMSVSLFMFGMNTWVWSPLEHSIALLTRDIASLTQTNQEAIQSIASLKDVEREVALMREKLPPTLEQLSIRVEPQAFRRKIMDIGKRTGVSVRLWKPQEELVERERFNGVLNILVKVEGSFYGTVQFLDELLQLSWIQTVNPLILSRKPYASSGSLVTTDFTIKGLTSPQVQPPKDMLKM